MTSKAVIDFNDYNLTIADHSEVDDDIVKRLGDKIIHVFKTFGYCYIKNHGVSEKLIESYFDVSRAFFELTTNEKIKYSLKPDYAFGWVKLESEKVDPKSEVNDLHEAFNYRPCSGYELWPEIENFESLTKEVFEVGKELGYRFCDVLSLGLNQPRSFFRCAHKLVGQDGNSGGLRTLWYPPIRKDTIPKPTQMRIGEHVDWGTVAFGFQDKVGGLEVRTPTAEFKSAGPIPGTIVVFIGGTLQRWTADELKATLHRIPIPGDEHMRGETRQSFFWFLDPDDQCVVKCFDGSNKYEPFTHRDYINFRIREAMSWLDPTNSSK